MFHFKSSLRAFQTSNYLPLQLELQYNVLLPPNAKESRWTPLIPAATYTTSSSPRRVPMNYSTFVVTMLDSWSGGSPDIARFCNDERGGNDKPELCIFAILVLGMKARWGLISKGGRYSTFVGVVGTWASISKLGTSRWQWAESYKIRARDETVPELRDRLACIVLNVRYVIKVPRRQRIVLLGWRVRRWWNLMRSTWGKSAWVWASWDCAVEMYCEPTLRPDNQKSIQVPIVERRFKGSRNISTKIMVSRALWMTDMCRSPPPSYTKCKLLFSSYSIQPALRLVHCQFHKAKGALLQNGRERVHVFGNRGEVSSWSWCCLLVPQLCGTEEKRVRPRYNITASRLWTT